MRLKCIKLAGFKSFVDPTTIPLPGNLIGVVGPNGCGKSNVIDAVRWVMGESSARHLRGESITDVIFNGSTARKPVGQASVELIFDNSAGTLGGEYASYAEISIRRQVTRDAQSSYFLNGTRCRRKDITDIFLGTGLGPRSYSIIEQGTISRLIEAKPEELRVYLEEAAGISKYKERRRETELRIQHTKDNLTRLHDIREELDKQLNHLQRQAAAAERYKVLKQEERLLKVQLHAIRWQQLNQQGQDYDHIIKELEVQLEAQIAGQRALEAEVETLRATQLEASDRFNEIQSRFYKLGAEISRLEQTLQYNRERKQQLQNDLVQAERMWQETQQHLEEDKHKVEELTAEQLLIEPEVELAKASADETGDALAEAEQTVRDWQGAWDEFNQQAANAAQRAQVEQTRIQHLEQHMQNVQQRLARLTQELASLNSAEQNDDILAAQEQAEELMLQQEAVEERIIQLLQQINNQHELNQQLANQLDAARSQLQSLRGRHASLEALQQAALGQRKGGLLYWLQQYQLDQHPRLAQELRVEQGWEKAVETVLGEYLEAVCAPGIAGITAALATLEQGTFIALDTEAQVQMATAAKAATLLDKVQSRLPLAVIISGVYIAETLSEAVVLAKTLAVHESVITKEGIWLGNGWIRVARDSDEHTGVLQRERELEELKITIETAEQRIQELQDAVTEGRQTLQAHEAQRDAEQRQLSDLKAAHANLTAQLQVKQGRLEQLRQRTNQIEQESEECRQLLNHDQQELLAARTAWNDAMQLMEQHADKRNQLLQARETYTSQLQHIRQQAQTQRDKAHHLTLHLQTITTQLQSIQQNRIRLEKQIENLQERRKSINQAITEAELPASDLQLELEQVLNERAKVENELISARQQLESYEFELRQAEQRRHGIEQMVLQIRSRLEHQRLEHQTLQVRRDTLLEQINEAQFEVEALVKELPPEAAEPEWQDQLERTSTKIERLGAVNLAAIEEYQVQAERKNYLDSQNEDLVQALETLEEAIRKIDRETRTKFKETFELVNNGFQTLFPRVFGGGRAYLELTGDDLLNTGITVMAQPPGKRNSTIHLLSGGEKAMTAAALVFAIFQLNPAPFCMLDEVDAPLDDANVGRFCSLVKEMSEKVQFIFITHNKVTMELAEYLSGVTMNEPGVSRLVAVDVEAALALAEA